MRHQKKRHKIGRGASHRKATLAALSSALIKHKRITTTVAKAKALRVFIEPLINRAKDQSMHSHRQVFRKLQDKHAVKELFGEIAEKVGDRPGGYTRVIRLGQRSGDGAEMAMIELVDYNDVKPEGSSKSRRRRTRRSRGGSRKKGGAAAAAAAVKDTAAEIADKVEDVAEAVADNVEDAVDTVKEAAADVGEKIEDAAEAVADKAEEIADAAKEKAEELIDKATGDEDEAKKDDA
ncbi:MAG: 50S ribosomal protein L17 [Bacteroidota bacterium]